MEHVCVAYVIRTQPRPATVLTFVHTDEGRANYLAGLAMDRLADNTGEAFAYHVDAIPLASSEQDVLRLVAETELPD